MRSGRYAAENAFVLTPPHTPQADFDTISGILTAFEMTEKVDHFKRLLFLGG